MRSLVARCFPKLRVCMCVCVVSKVNHPNHFLGSSNSVQWNKLRTTPTEALLSHSQVVISYLWLVYITHEDLSCVSSQGKKKRRRKETFSIYNFTKGQFPVPLLEYFTYNYYLKDLLSHMLSPPHPLKIYSGTFEAIPVQHQTWPHSTLFYCYSSLRLKFYLPLSIHTPTVWLNKK